MHKVYPYIPNSNPIVRKEMLDYIGKKSVEEMYQFLPQDARMHGVLHLPEPFESELALKAHVDSILSVNSTCSENISFLGAGCYDHYVPAICDEINSRSEFLTAYSGDTYVDHGKCQAYFEFNSLMGELLDMDVVSFPTYDGGHALCTAILMSHRINNRKNVLLPASFSPSLLSQVQCYCDTMNLITIAIDKRGQIDIEDLKQKINNETACVVIQNPSFLGHFEENARYITEIAHNTGAEMVVYADPSSLGVVEPPADYGADIACGDIQPLGIHMSYGSGLGGYLATREEERYIMNFPHHLYMIFKNSHGEFGFNRALPQRTSYNRREKGVEFVGTCVGLWAITAAVYLSIMGPEGMRELGENILYKSRYAKIKLSHINGAKLLFADSFSFKEFVINFDDSNMTVKQINNALISRHIFGGYDLSKEMPELGQSMLICVTEKTTQHAIDNLAKELSSILA